jgi:hypothetical protein
MIVLTIDEPTPSLNPQLGHHWSRKIKLRNRWFWLVRKALNEVGVFNRPTYAQARLTLERYGPRHLDHDNCRSGAKYLWDALVKHGVILNDCPDVIGEPVVRQIASKTERKTVVRIEAVCSTLPQGPLEPEKIS